MGDAANPPPEIAAVGGVERRLEPGPTAAAPEAVDALPTDDERLAAYATALADGIDEVLPMWVLRCVRDRADAWQPGLGAELTSAAVAAGQRAVAEVGDQVRALLLADVDAQATGPLALLRRAVAHPTEVLAAAGVPEVVRDEFAQRAFPADVYDLAPAAFADLDPSLHEPGLVWGAAKAHVVLSRRRSEGRR